MNSGLCFSPGILISSAVCKSLCSGFASGVSAEWLWWQTGDWGEVSPQCPVPRLQLEERSMLLRVPSSSGVVASKQRRWCWGATGVGYCLGTFPIRDQGIHFLHCVSPLLPCFAVGMNKGSLPFFSQNNREERRQWLTVHPSYCHPVGNGDSKECRVSFQLLEEQNLFLSRGWPCSST